MTEDVWRNHLAQLYCSIIVQLLWGLAPDETLIEMQIRVYFDLSHSPCEHNSGATLPMQMCLILAVRNNIEGLPKSMCSIVYLPHISQLPLELPGGGLCGARHVLRGFRGSGNRGAFRGDRRAGCVGQQQLHAGAAAVGGVGVAAHLRLRVGLLGRGARPPVLQTEHRCCGARLVRLLLDVQLLILQSGCCIGAVHVMLLLTLWVRSHAKVVRLLLLLLLLVLPLSLLCILKHSCRNLLGSKPLCSCRFRFLVSICIQIPSLLWNRVLDIGVSTHKLTTAKFDRGSTIVKATSLVSKRHRKARHVAGCPHSLELH